MSDAESDFERDYPWLDAEGDCPWCDGTGEIVHDACCGSGCQQCIDGCVTCPVCGGSGYHPDNFVGPEDE